MTTILNRLALVLLALLLVVPASAQSDEIEDMLRERDAEIKEIVGESGDVSRPQREKLMAVANRVLDFEAMGREALGPYWNELSAERRDDFTEAFGKVVRAQSLSDLNLYRAPVDYGDIEVRGDIATAHTTVTAADISAAVTYTLMRQEDGWKITDIAIDQASTVGAYATSFQRVMRRKGIEDGYETLMKSLRRRLARG